MHLLSNLYTGDKIEVVIVIRNWYNNSVTSTHKMATLCESKKSTKQFNCAIEQAIMKQDYVKLGSNDKFQWIVCSDGHGRLPRCKNGRKINLVVDLLRSVDWDELLREDNFYALLQKKLAAIDTRGSGATLSVVKIFPTYFECHWVGDSPITVYSGGKVIWDMKCHKPSNPAEIARLATLKVPYPGNKMRKVRFEPDFNVKVLSPKTITMVKSNYIVFGPRDMINMTHALGHSGVTGNFISSARIERRPGQVYKVIAATDGITSMMCEDDEPFLASKEADSDAILTLALKRWCQPWEYDGKMEQFPRSNVDDCAIGVWMG